SQSRGERRGPPSWWPARTHVPEWSLPGNSPPRRRRSGFSRDKVGSLGDTLRRSRRVATGCEGYRENREEQRICSSFEELTQRRKVAKRNLFLASLRLRASSQK